MKLIRLLSSYLTLGVIVNAFPNQIQNGQAEDAIPVMSNFEWLRSQVNANVPPLIPSLGSLTAFTPTVLYGGANVGMTFFNQFGQYYRIGNIVWFMFDVGINAQGTSAGVATIGGLPFTISAALLSNFYPILCCTVNVTFTAGGASVPVLRLIPGTTTLQISSMADNGNMTNLSSVQVDSLCAISGQGFYFV